MQICEQSNSKFDEFFSRKEGQIDRIAQLPNMTFDDMAMIPQLTTDHSH